MFAINCSNDVNSEKCSYFLEDFSEVQLSQVIFYIDLQGIPFEIVNVNSFG